MQISVSATKLHEELPEDIKAVLALFPENLCLECTEGPISGYIDVYDEVKEGYFFQQAYAPFGLQTRRFISWVRAGMPEGYNEIVDERGVWTRED